MASGKALLEKSPFLQPKSLLSLFNHILVNKILQKLHKLLQTSYNNNIISLNTYFIWIWFVYTSISSNSAKLNTNLTYYFFCMIIAFLLFSGWYTKLTIITLFFICKIFLYLFNYSLFFLALTLLLTIFISICVRGKKLMLNSPLKMQCNFF